MNAETKHPPGPWNASKFGCQVLTGDSWSSICELKGDARWEDGRGSYQQEYEWQVQEANARLIAAAPEMAEALQAEEEADRLFDAADEYTHRAEGEGWLNDPTGSLHVTEAWDRARQARERAKELRRAALSKTGG